ncbi:MAG TPA: hypothetical protein VN372_14500 [Methanospirillum sp.]|nr:hypothetical protein [Methanospirillum sp.]
MSDDLFPVDIVILPPESIQTIALSLNSDLIKLNGISPITLGEHMLPHISIAMCSITSGELKILGKELDRLCTVHLPLRLSITGLSTMQTNSGDYISGLDIDLTDALYRFHQEIINVVHPWCNRKVLSEMILLDPGEKLAPFTTVYIENFRERSALTDYHPHITLGYGYHIPKIDSLEFPNNFSGNLIAVCRLGNHCTCREILWKN